MALRWRYEDADSGAAPGPDVSFEDQADAEEWLGLQWQSLLDDGVEAVTLLDEAEEVYGPMSLHPE